MTWQGKLTAMNKELEELKAKQERAERQVIAAMHMHTHTHTHTHTLCLLCMGMCIWCLSTLILLSVNCLDGFCAIVASDCEGGERVKSQRW